MHNSDKYLCLKLSNITRIAVILIVTIWFLHCTQRNKKNDLALDYINLFETNNPILTIGSDEEKAKVGIYKWILHYFIDIQGNIYIPDLRYLKIDKFDDSGNYILSFGRKGQGPGEFSTSIGSFAVDSIGNLIAHSNSRKSLMIFSKDGKFIEEAKLPDEFMKLYIRKIKVDGNNNLFILVYSNRTKEYILGKYNIKNRKYIVFHKDNQRVRPPFVDLLPDFDFDWTGNVYICDTIEYKIFKYSNQGQLIDIFTKNMKKNKIVENDFNILLANKITKIPGYQFAMTQLKGPSGFFPNIFGINIDGKKIYIWTSNQDAERKYIIEIFDMNFNPICTSSYYNYLPENYAFIKNNKFYIKNIESDNPELKKRIGRFGIFNVAYKINVYQISKEINKNQK